MGREFKGWRNCVGTVGRVVVVPGGWGVEENPTPKACEFPPPKAWSLTYYTGLSNIESGGPQAADNNFVGCETLEKLQ